MSEDVLQATVDGAGAPLFERIAFIAFTQRGCELAVRLAADVRVSEALGRPQADVSGPERIADGIWRDVSSGDLPHGVMHAQRAALARDESPDDMSRVTNPCIQPYESLDSWTRVAFGRADALVFVGATGIAVRAIAPYVCDKFADPAVVGIDEAGRFAVPLLSGHVGGANVLARELAALSGGQAAVSTATDVSGLFAVDEWARSQGLVIAERELAKKVSAALLAGETVGYLCEYAIAGDEPDHVELWAEDVTTRVGFLVSPDSAWEPFEHTLHLLPRTVTVGVGCRRGADVQVLRGAVKRALGMAGIDERCVRALASIDVKRDEPAIAQLAQELDCETRFYSAERLRAVPGDFEESAFVADQVGVGNVCERAAAAEGGRLVVSKQAGDGVTVAVALRDPHLEW